MDIILKQDVDLLGSKYDVVTVKDGYARNFLIPQGLAVAATKSNVKVNDEVIRQQAHKPPKPKRLRKPLHPSSKASASSSAPRLERAEDLRICQLHPVGRRHPRRGLRHRAQADSPADDTIKELGSTRPREAPQRSDRDGQVRGGR